MATTRSGDRLNPTDATLWAIKRDPELRTTIVGLGLLDGRPEWATLQAAVARAVERLPRFRQRVVERPLGLGRPQWVEATPDLAFHLRRAAAPEPGDLRAVLDLCGVLAAEDFDETRPLWQIHVVEGLTDERSALVVKVSHSLTDGIGGIGLLRLFGDEPGDGSVGPASERADAAATGHRAARGGPSLPTAVATAAIRAGRHPIRSMSGAIGLTGSATRLLAPAGQPLSTLLTDRGAGRWAGATELPLDRLRRAAHRAGGSINDAFVTIAISALADYHAELGSGARRFRVTLPVDLRPRTGQSAPAGVDPDERAGGNQWAPARLVLEVDLAAHPFAELRKHRHVLQSAIHEPAISFGQVLAAGLLELPPALTTGVVGGMVKGSDIAITDVPGLTESLTIAGSELTRFFPFAPLGGAALNVGLVSHLGIACIGFNIDTAAVAEPERLVRCFEARAADFLRRRRPPADSRPAGTSAGTSAESEQRPTIPAGRAARDEPGGERLSALDTSFLRMESATTPMHMGGLFVIDGRGLLTRDGSLDIAALRRHVDRRIERVPRLGKKLREVPLELGRPVWVDDPRFDIARHVRCRTLPFPGTRTQLFELCADLQMELLDRDRPLFELTFVDGLDPDEFGPGAVGLVERVHHALLDGMSGVEMVALLFDTDPGIALPTERESMQRRSVEPAPGRVGLLVNAAADQVREPLELAKLTGRAITSPRRTAAELARVAGTITDLLDPSHLRSGPLRRRVGSRRHLRAISMPLDLVHDTGVRLGGTVNDMVLTAVSCGVRALLERERAPLHGPFTALVPVSTRHAGMDTEHGNQVAALVVELPIDEARPQAALTILSDRTRHLKEEHRAHGSELLLDAGDHLPPLAVDLVTRLVAHQWSVDLVVTNLPGPPMPLYLCGGRVRELLPIVPLGANLPVGVAVLSYDGRLVLTFHAADQIGDGLDVMVAAAEAAFRDLAAASTADPAESS